MKKQSIFVILLVIIFILMLSTITLATDTTTLNENVTTKQTEDSIRTVFDTINSKWKNSRNNNYCCNNSCNYLGFN